MKENKMSENKNVLIGRNAVMEALKSGREIEKITVAKGAEGSIKKIVAQAKEKKIPVYYADKQALDRIGGDRPHQGVAAHVSAFEYCEVEDILQVAKDSGEDPFVVILDNLEDPHNLGAIMRTAECVGAHGIVIPKRRSVSVTDTVAKASAGAVEYMKVAKVTNISQTIEKLQENGLWIGACDMDGDTYYRSNLTGPIGIVIGSEGNGISKLVKSKCDFVVSMPMVGKITSLNASNAAAILMYEVRKQRDTK
jgi:23S rRNA (guanosine2251-2'-O)-methyltransferase